MQDEPGQISFPNRHPICSRQCDGVRSFCQHLVTLGWPSARSAPDSSLCAYSQSASSTLPDDSLGGLSPNRSSEPQRLSSGAMDHPTSYQSESSTHHSQIFDNRNEAEPAGIKPFRHERLSGCERSQCNVARHSIRELMEVVTIRIHCQPGSGLKAPCGIVVNYYPNTDRMKTTVQHPPQVAPEGVAQDPVSSL